jgi:hypothetical protein
LASSACKDYWAAHFGHTPTALHLISDPGEHGYPEYPAFVREDDQPQIQMFDSVLGRLSRLNTLIVDAISGYSVLFLTCLGGLRELEHLQLESDRPEWQLHEADAQLAGHAMGSLSALKT